MPVGRTAEQAESIRWPICAEYEGEVFRINQLPLTEIEARIVETLRDGEWHRARELETLLSSSGLADGALAAGIVAQAVAALHTLGYAIGENGAGAYQLQMEPSSG